MCVSFFDLSDRNRLEAGLRFLADASAELGKSLDVDETLRALCRAAVPALADACAVHLLDEGGLRRAAVSRFDRALGGAAITTNAPPAVDDWRAAREALAAGDARLVAGDAAAPPALFGDPAERPRSVAILPLSAGSAPAGVLSLWSIRRPRDYDATDLALAKRFASLAAGALENARRFRATAEAKRLRDETLGIVAHDLRTPLTTIGLCAELIEDAHPDARADVDAINASLGHATRLLEDLLTAAKAEEGKLTLDLQACAAEGLLDEAIALQRAAAASRSVTLSSAIEPGVATAHVDRKRIVQALLNLVSNALKFTPAGGRVSLSAWRDGDRLVLSVADTGAGIAPDELPRLFDRFWQGRRARRADAGLGLAIVKGIAEAHGGTVGVTSGPGGGSTFTLVLPAAAGRADALAPARVSPRPRDDGLRLAPRPPAPGTAIRSGARRRRPSRSPPDAAGRRRARSPPSGCLRPGSARPPGGDVGFNGRAAAAGAGAPRTGRRASASEGAVVPRLAS